MLLRWGWGKGLAKKRLKQKGGAGRREVHLCFLNNLQIDSSLIIVHLIIHLQYTYTYLYVYGYIVEVGYTEQKQTREEGGSKSNFSWNMIHRK